MHFAIALSLLVSHTVAFFLGGVYKSKVLAEKESLKKRAEDFIHKV
jgi:hypothetical protein